MSYNQYSGYGGNPYGSDGQAGGYGQSNPYQSDAGNPYGQGQNDGGLQSPPIEPQTSNYSAQSNYSQQTPLPGQQPGQQQRVEYVRPERSVMSNQDFLSRVEAVKADIRTLTTQVGSIASTHQRTLSSPDSSSSSQQLESMITQSQVLNTSIKDQIKTLEKDAVQSKDNQVKNTQINQLKTSFQKQLQEYRQEEASYERRYREQIARQYRIVNPEATESEVQEASQADWGNEGVFQTALKSNRSATASSVLGAVRARHNDIQKIERTIQELNQLMEDLATTVVLQDEPVQAVEAHTDNVKKDTEAGNVQLGKGIEHARRARKLKWWCFFICVAIVIILGLVLGVPFAVKQWHHWIKVCGKKDCDEWGWYNATASPADWNIEYFGDEADGGR